MFRRTGSFTALEDRELEASPEEMEGSIAIKERMLLLIKRIVFGSIYGVSAVPRAELQRRIRAVAPERGIK